MAGLKALFVGASAAAVMSTAQGQGYQPPGQPLSPEQKAEVLYSKIVTSESCLVAFNNRVNESRANPNIDNRLSNVPEVEREAGLSSKGPVMAFAVRWGMPRGVQLGSFDALESSQLCGQLGFITTTDSTRTTLPIAANNAVVGLPVIKYVADNVRTALTEKASPQRMDEVHMDSVEQLAKAFTMMGGYTYKYLPPMVRINSAPAATPTRPANMVAVR